jgi:hypothetical protein
MRSIWAYKECNYFRLFKIFTIFYSEILKGNFGVDSGLILKWM